MTLQNHPVLTPKIDPKIDPKNDLFQTLPNHPKNRGPKSVQKSVPNERVIKYPQKCALFCPPGAPKSGIWEKLPPCNTDKYRIGSVFGVQKVHFFAPRNPGGISPDFPGAPRARARRPGEPKNGVLERVDFGVVFDPIFDPIFDP